jgi:UTP--glucose-1-phosphate uridylyltransferase
MPEIFARLEKKETGAGGEIQITDAMAKLLEDQPIYGHVFEGTRFDCGSKAGFQMANIAYALEYPDIRNRLLPFLKSYLSREDLEAD